MYLSKTAFRYRPVILYQMNIRNFASAKEYDLAIIGGGPGGKITYFYNNAMLYRLCGCYQSCLERLEDCMH